MKKQFYLITLITQKSLIKSIFLSLSAVCIIVSFFSYILSYQTTSKILGNRLSEYTRSQLALNNQSFKANFDTVELISDNLLNTLYQYDPLSPLSYISRINQLSSTQDLETIQFVNYTLNALDFYVKNYPILDSILLYTRTGTVIASTGTYTKVQIVHPQSSDFILNDVIPDFDPEITSFLWLGGFDSSDFVAGSSQYEQNGQSSNYVFTGIRRLKRSYNSQEDLFLVFNLKQEAIRDIYYTYPISSDNDSVFLLDSDGKVLFSSDTSLIGTISPHAEKLTEQNRFVSFSRKIDGQKYNIFYQTLDNTGWFVLYQISSEIYASDVNSFRNLSILIFSLTMFLLLLCVLWLIIRKLQPLRELSEAVSRIGDGNLGYTIPIHEKNEIGILAQQFNQMSLNLKRILSEKEQIEEQKRHQEIAALQAQINPHFILNTINTVKWMAILNHVPNISECLTAFGRLLEPLLKRQTDFYTVKEELLYLENYVEVMNYSYGNTIHMTLSVPDNLHACKIPRFILQPLVENAVLHGADKATNEVHIEVVLSERNDTLQLAVYSYGTTIEPQKLHTIQQSLISGSSIPGSRTSSIGLTNIMQRIQVFYGKSYGLWIENSAERQVKVTVTLPLEYFSR